MSDEYIRVHGTIREIRQDSILFAVGQLVPRAAWIPRSLIHGADNIALRALQPGAVRTLQIREWKAEEIGFAGTHNPDAAAGDLFGADAPIGAKVAHVKAQPQTRAHHCHWIGCSAQVPPAMWGCKRHWYALPKELRDKIWRTYRPGQETDQSPSRAYLAVAREVQAWIRTSLSPARGNSSFNQEG